MLIVVARFVPNGVASCFQNQRPVLYSYFKDADEDLEVDRFRLFEKISWGKIKNYIVKEVNEERFQL